MTPGQEDAWFIRCLRARQRSWQVRAAGIGRVAAPRFTSQKAWRAIGEPTERAASVATDRGPEGVGGTTPPPTPSTAPLGPPGVGRLAAAQREEQVLQRDLDRAGVHAGAAQRRRVGQLGRLGVVAGEQRREHGADGPAVHPAVGVPADLAVDGAHVEAGAAADAAEDLVQLGAEQVAAAVVEDDDVQLVGAVGLARPRGPVTMFV